jgi:hypothetical protein
MVGVKPSPPPPARLPFGPVSFGFYYIILLRASILASVPAIMLLQSVITLWALARIWPSGRWLPGAINPSFSQEAREQLPYTQMDLRQHNPAWRL